MPDSQLIHLTDLYSEHERKTSVVYNEFSTLVHYRNSINMRLDGPDGSSIFWAAHDPLNSEGWSSSQLDLIWRLLPHIRQYVCVQSVIGRRGCALGASLTEMLDTTGLGIIQLDPSRADRG